MYGSSLFQTFNEVYTLFMIKGFLLYSFAQRNLKIYLSYAVPAAQGYLLGYLVPAGHEVKMFCQIF
jgi:hypothetical protein